MRDSTLTGQCDDVSSTLAFRADAAIEATDIVSLPSTAQSSFFLALAPTELKQLLADDQSANHVFSTQSEMPDDPSQFDVLPTAASSPSSSQRDAASRLAHPSQGRAWKYSAEAPIRSDIATNNSLINFLAASSCLVTGEL